MIADPQLLSSRLFIINYMSTIKTLIASLIFYTLNSLLSFAKKSQLLETFRFPFFFFLRFVPSSFLLFVPVPPPNKLHAPRSDSSIGRALSQLLSIVNDIPVSSRKYEVVRSLAERIIEENHSEGSDDAHALRRVNREVLVSAFARTLGRLDAAARGGEVGSGAGEWLVMKVVGWRGGEAKVNGVVTAEKLAAELVWLAEKMAGCGCGKEAVRMLAAAQDLGWLALTVEPRLQASLLKLAAFLFKEAKNLELDETDKSRMEAQMQVKLKMLQSWLPLLCRGSNGIDAPVLSISERKEIEKVLEEIIEGLEQDEEQEKVLSLWLHHFTHCPSSDWPNLHASYARWCNASRKQLLQSTLIETITN